MSVHVQLLLAFSLCNLHGSCRGAASAGGKVEKKHLKLAELGSVAAVFVSGCRESHDEDYARVLSCDSGEGRSRSRNSSGLSGCF